MDIYNFDPTTGEFQFQSQADPDPLQEGEFLIPANATSIAPPDSEEGKVAVFVDGAWGLLTDHRDTKYWTPEGVEVTIQDIGETPPANALFERPDLRTIDEIKNKAIALVNSRHAAFLRNLTGNATIEERDTWQAKALAAETIQAGTASAIQQEMIATEASVVGETEEQLVQTILAKYGAYQKLIGLASGLRRKTETALSAASNKEEIDQVLAASDEQSKQFVQQWQSGG